MVRRARASFGAGSLTVAFTCLGLALVPARAGAQALWGELRLPGGVEAARETFQLANAEGHLDAGWLADFVRHYTADRLPSAADTLNRYLNVLADVEAQSAQWPNGVTRPGPATTDADRRRIEKFLGVLGLKIERDGHDDKVVIDPDTSREATERTAWLVRQGIDRTSLAAELNAGQPVVIHIADGTLPLPLPGYWEQNVFKRGAPSVSAIVDDQSTAFTYLALLASDDDTLRFLSTRPELIHRLGNEAGGALAAFGRSIRIRDGVVQVPGGDSAIDIWSAVVGHQPRDAEAFVTGLLSQDSGRLAYFYDTVSHLLPPQQAFALGAELPAGARVASVRHLYDAFARLDPDWKIPGRPFFRPRFDAAEALMSIDVQPDGSIGPSWWPPLLEHVWSTDDWPKTVSGAALKPRTADAAWLVDWVFQQRAGALDRFQLLRFLQRRFSGAPPASAHAIEIALRCRKDMPALALTLERMGVSDEHVATAVIVAAHELTDAGDRDVVTPALARWQAALALLEHARRRAVLPVPRVNALLISLAAIAPVDLEKSNGAFGTWVVDQFLPALASETVRFDDVDQQVVAALAGSDNPSARVSWEGLDYVVDRSGPVERTAWAVQQASAGPHVRDLIALEGVRRELERDPATLADVSEAARLLRDLEPALAARPAPEKNTDLDEFSAAVAGLRGITQQADVARARRALPSVLRVLDLSAECVARSLVYALAVAPTTEPPEVFASTWYFHTLEPAVMEVQPEQFARTKSWKHVAWQLPAVEPRHEGGTLVRGSLLGVDLALSDSQVPTALLTDTTAMPVVADSARGPLIRSLALRESPGSFSAPDATALLAALEAGRRRIAAWEDHVPGSEEIVDALRGAGVDEWRANLLAWQWSHDARVRTASLTMREFYGLGTSENLPAAWTGADMGPDGCLCFARSPMRSPESMRGRDADAARVVVSNLSLYLLEQLDRLRLPSSLVPLMMPRAMETWLGHVVQYESADWEAFTAWPRGTGEGGVDDILMALLSDGSIRPPHEGEFEKQP